MTSSGSDTPLRDLLVAAELVSPKAVEEALRVQEARGGELAETLIDLGYLRVDKFEAFIVSQPGIASIDLSQYKIMRELCDLIPEETARTHKLFPIDKMGKLLTVGMAMPLDTDTIAKLAELTGLRVKAVYCNPEHIQGALDRYYETDETSALGDLQAVYGRARGSSTMVSIASLLRGIDDLPALPETVTKTKEALDDPTISMEEVETMIGSDPMVSAKVLKLANSAAYKFSRRIDDVGMAMRLLGLQETYNLVLASSVLAMTEGAKGFDYQRTWQEALFTAAAVPAVAAKVDFKPSAAMATAGLLHDIGRFALAHVSPADYGKIDKQGAGKDLVKLEEEAVGLGHPEAGYMVADRWELPEEIATLIRFHHTPELAESMQKEASIVSLAAFLSEAHSKQTDLKTGEAFKEVQSVIESLGLSTDQLLDIYSETASNLAA